MFPSFGRRLTETWTETCRGHLRCQGGAVSYCPLLCQQRLNTTLKSSPQPARDGGGEEERPAASDSNVFRFKLNLIQPKNQSDPEEDEIQINTESHRKTVTRVAHLVSPCQWCHQVLSSCDRGEAPVVTSLHRVWSAPAQKWPVPPVCYWRWSIKVLMSDNLV